MKTIVTINANDITVEIAGITLTINPEELFSSLNTIEKFITNIWPDKRKADLESLPITEFFNVLRKYEPIIWKFITSWEFKDQAQSTIVIHEDGMIDMESNAQSARFNMKQFMEAVSEMCDVMDEIRGSNDEELSYLTLPSDKTSLNVLSDILGEEKWSIRVILKDIHYLIASDDQLLPNEVAEEVASRLGYRVKFEDNIEDEAPDYSPLYSEEDHNRALEEDEQSMLEIPEGIQRVDFYRTLKANGLISQYPEVKSHTWLSQKMTQDMIYREAITLNVSFSSFVVIPKNEDATDEALENLKNAMRK